MNMVVVGTLLLAMLHDTPGTAFLLARSVGVRGVTWIATKVADNISTDASQIINLTGWSIAGISIVKIISNAMGSIGEVTTFFVNTAEFFDKITFWN